MRCYHKFGAFLGLRTLASGGFFCCVPACPGPFADGNGNSSTYQYIYNLTICELNGTGWLANHFEWAVETFVLLARLQSYPLTGFTHNKPFFSRARPQCCVHYRVLWQTGCTHQSLRRLCSHPDRVLCHPRLSKICVASGYAQSRVYQLHCGRPREDSEMEISQSRGEIGDIRKRWRTSSPSNISSSEGLKLNPDEDLGWNK
uniref:Envelope glycoprotein n=1 Tax=Porcine reproductive and respiratory syndrome virus TaxID=28344 RepID=Q8QQV2_PRRSV|nr:envelope glycoprotein [Porcine reproductive and respiratory syndrome virus]